MLNISCIFSICASILFILSPFYFQDFGSFLLLLFWIFSCRLPILIFFLSCGVLPCSFVYCMFLYLFILFSLLCLGSPFCRSYFLLFVESVPHHIWGWTSVFWRFLGLRDLHLCSCGWSWIFFSLKGSLASSGVFWGIYGLGMVLGSLSANRHCCVPVLFRILCETSITGAHRPLSGAWS